MVLHGFTSWISITEQVLDGPPGDATRRLSSFLLIPVGYNRQGFAYVDLHRLQKALFADARDASVGHQVEVLTLRLNRGQPHPLAAFDAGHLDSGFKARAGRRRPGYLQHRILGFQRGDATLSTWTNESASTMSDSRHNWNGAPQVHVQDSAFRGATRFGVLACFDLIVNRRCTVALPIQINRSWIASSAMPFGAALHTSPGTIGIAFVNVPVLTISPAASGGLSGSLASRPVR